MKLMKLKMVMASAVGFSTQQGTEEEKDEEMDARMKACIDAVTREEWAAMAVRTEGTLRRGQRAALDAAEDQYNRQAEEGEEEISGYAEMLQMWKGSKPGGWSMAGDTKNRTCEEVGDVSIVEQVWKCAMPPFSTMAEEKPVWGSTTVEAVDAVIEARLESVHARM